MERLSKLLIIFTDNTNSRHLELYCVMIEIDNVGYPVSYLLMTTATAIDQQKRTKSLASWARQLRDRYDIQPVFAHTDKDMAEIGCLKEVWDPKINLCWWHLRRAVKTRLAKAKLATTPYNAGRAHHEFAFIDTSFKPACNRTDTGDFEGGVHSKSRRAPSRCRCRHQSRHRHLLSHRIPRVDSGHDGKALLCTSSHPWI